MVATDAAEEGSEMATYQIECRGNGGWTTSDEDGEALPVLTSLPDVVAELRRLNNGRDAVYRAVEMLPERPPAGSVRRQAPASVYGQTEYVFTADQVDVIMRALRRVIDHDLTARSRVIQAATHEPYTPDLSAHVSVLREIADAIGRRE